MDNVINNPITGKTKFTVTDDGVFNAVTGRQVGVIVDGMVVSPVSGQPFAIVVQNSEGGVDLSFITAAASDILSGKVGADSSGNPVTGTIPKKAAATITPGTADQTIAAGTYLSGKQTIKGDANLLPENIKKDVLLFGVVGTHEGGGNAGSVELYKCASVDAAMQTWSGYKAVESDGEYVFADTVTAGLSCAGGLNVKKGKVYTADGKIRSSKAYNHCICIFPFNMNYEDMRGNCKIPLLHYGYQPRDQAYCDVAQRHWGAGSLRFNTNYIIGSSILIKDLPKMQSFTCEFWHFRHLVPGSNNYGKSSGMLPGYLSNKPEGSERTTEILYGTEAGFVGLPTGRWFHHAFVKPQGSTTVHEFVDGVLYATLSFPYDLGGAGFSAVQFSTMPALYNPDTKDFAVDGADGYYGVMGNTPGDHIADFSIWDIAKYSGNFTPPAQPYKIVWEDTPTITLSGAGLEDVNGVYELITPEAAGKSRVWAKPMSPYLIKYDDDWCCWLIKNGENNCYSGSESDNPWDDEWYDATDDESGGEAPTFTVNE